MSTVTGPPRQRAAGSQAPRRLAVVAVVVAVVLYGLLAHAQRHNFFDLKIYWASIRWWLDGQPLYEYVQPNTGGFGFTYPPFAALCLLPFAVVPLGVAQALIFVLTAAAIVLTTWWLVAPVAERHGWPRWYALALAVPLVCALEPVRETVGFGQVNMLLVVLLLADVRALARGSRWAGVGTGLAAAVKITPALFIVYLLVTRRWRAAGVATGTAAGATLVAAVLSPSTSWQFWTHTLWDTSRVGRLDYASNQSLLGLLARLADPAPPSRLLWLVLVLPLAAVGLWRAAQAYRLGDDLAGVTLTGLTTVLLSPISWTHHLYWVVPALVVLVDVAARSAGHRRAVPLAAAGVVYACLALSMIWPFNHSPGEHWSDGVPGVVLENAYVLVCLALVAWLPARSAAGLPGCATPGPPAALPSVSRTSGSGTPAAR